MSISIKTNDVVWNRMGDPLLIAHKDKDGQVKLDEEFKNIRSQTKFGVKNGLDPEVKDVYQTILSDVDNTNKREEIDNLYTQIRKLKGQNADPRLIKYLEGDLKYRIVREAYKPPDYTENPIALGF